MDDINDMNNILYKSLLYDFYGKLLTERQKSCYEMYYFENLTLGEIGSELGVTLQAAGDIIRRTEKNLLDYEQKLGIVSEHENRSRILKGLYDALETLKALKADEEGFKDKIDGLKADIAQLLM